MTFHVHLGLFIHCCSGLVDIFSRNKLLVGVTLALLPVNILLYELLRRQQSFIYVINIFGLLVLLIFVRESEKFFVHVICVENLVGVLGFLCHFADSEVFCFEMVVFHVLRYLDGELVHRLVCPLSHCELLLHGCVVVLVEVDRLAHIKVHLSKGCGVD